MATRRTKAYQTYRDKFYAQKKRGNVKNGVRVLTQSQYKRAQKEGLSDRKILKAQTILESKAKEQQAWREYTKIKKQFSRGEQYEMEGTYFGENYDEEDDSLSDGLGYHYSLSGLLHDRHALHFLIAFKIDAGYDRKEVLADYGY